MNVLKKIILLTLIVTPSHLAAEIEWMYIGCAEDKTCFFVDDESVNIIDDNNIYAWSLMNEPKTQADGTSSMMYLWLFDCQHKKSSMKKVISFSEPWGKGNVISELSYNQPSEFVRPGTLLTQIMKRACRQAFSY